MTYSLTKLVIDIYKGVLNREPKYVAGFICGTIFILLLIFISYHIFYIDHDDNDVKVNDNVDTDGKINDFYKELAKQEAEDVFLEGSTERYEWKQNEKEIDIYIPIDDNITSKNIKIDFKNNKIDITIDNMNFKLYEETFEEIVPYECVWQLESNNCDNHNHSNKCLWITIVKKLPTNHKCHWKGVFKADIDYNKINNSKSNVYSIDNNDPDSLKEAIKNLKDKLKDKTNNKKNN